MKRHQQYKQRNFQTKQRKVQAKRSHTEDRKREAFTHPGYEVKYNLRSEPSLFFLQDGHGKSFIGAAFPVSGFASAEPFLPRRSAGYAFGISNSSEEQREGMLRDLAEAMYSQVVTMDAEKDHGKV